jgi:hypothetical protein
LIVPIIFGKEQSYEAHHYAIFSSLLSFHPWVQIISSAPYSQIPSVASSIKEQNYTSTLNAWKITANSFWSSPSLVSRHGNVFKIQLKCLKGTLQSIFRLVVEWVILSGWAPTLNFVVLKII